MATALTPAEQAAAEAFHWSLCLGCQDNHGCTGMDDRDKKYGALAVAAARPIIEAEALARVADDLREWAVSEPDIRVRRGMQIAADIVRTHATRKD